MTGPWRALRLVVGLEDGTAIGGAQVLIRKVPFPFRGLAYIPWGPFAARQDLTRVAETVSDYLRERGGLVCATFEPPVDVAVGFAPTGGVPVDTEVLLSATVILDLGQDTDSLLAQMAKKTRSYVRRSLRDGVSVRRARTEGDIEKCLDIYEETAQRAGFSLHSRNYYRTIHRELGDQAPAYLAEVDGETVAFLWLIASDRVGMELYGGANARGLQTRANYGLKWEAICDQKAAGVQEYDLNGLLDPGVTQFKKGFSDHSNLLCGTVEVPLSRLYSLWTAALPIARGTMRRAKQAERSARTRRWVASHSRDAS